MLFIHERSLRLPMHCTLALARPDGTFSKIRDQKTISVNTSDHEESTQLNPNLEKTALQLSVIVRCGEVQQIGTRRRQPLAS